ncbi:MAG: SNF2-related protein, partial [Niameybacter sp.]
MNQSDLHGYQTFAVKHILAEPYCGLFLDMGLGKTVSTLTAIQKLLYEELEILNCLVIAPKRVAETVWSDECQKWEHLKGLKVSKIIGNEQARIAALKTKADIYIISRDNVAWLCAYYGALTLPFDMIVIDESSSFKSHKSLRIKALRQIRP